jgi:asparagine synthase (glutamine-hydrolysing)
MCGISGIINKNGLRVPHVEIRSINDLIAHRGPDGQGFYSYNNIALGHRRLSILDRSPAGQQPMGYKDRYVITFNGEIYNHVELREQLSGDGYTFASKTDTEIILAAYDKWGADCVARFNGMWAFALFDKEKQEIFCSRDRFGIKPFYYADTADNFVFGSEIKQILMGAKVGAVANIGMVRDFLVEGYHDHTNQTFFQGIHSLKGGHNLIFSLKKNRFREVRYYSLDLHPGVAGLGDQSAAALIRSGLESAVNYQLRSDVKVGVCLSGGIDSSSIAALSSTLYQTGSMGRLQAIHARSSENDKDESAYARDLAERSDIDLALIEPSTEEFIEAIDDVVYYQEEPFLTPSIFMQYFVYREAKKRGCKVMLDGQGADEILLGYERYYSAHLRSMRSRLALKEIFLIKNNSRMSLRATLACLVYFSVAPVRIRNLRRRSRFLKAAHLKWFPNIVKVTDAGADMRQLQKMEIESFQLPHLLRYMDKNSMRHSVEGRVPFLDHKFVETCYGISNQLKIKDGWTKYILRVAMKGVVPGSVLWRKDKFGFEAPSASWMNKMRSVMELVIRQSRLLQEMCVYPLDFNKIDQATFWKLYSIAKWEAVYAVASGAGLASRPAAIAEPEKLAGFALHQAAWQAQVK